ncbi:MAG: hypothetical protein AAF585_12320 [Verrucomicrobiota bacterium]
MNGIWKAGPRLMLTALAAGTLALSSCSLHPTKTRIYTSKDREGAISKPAPGEVTKGDSFTTRGAWFCPTVSCEYRDISKGAAFRSHAAQACPFCGTQLEKK